MGIDFTQYTSYTTIYPEVCPGIYSNSSCKVVSEISPTTGYYEETEEQQFDEAYHLSLREKLFKRMERIYKKWEKRRIGSLIRLPYYLDFKRYNMFPCPDGNTEIVSENFPSTGGCLEAGQSEESYLVSWISEFGDQIFELPTGGVCNMEKGKNLI